MDIAVVTYAGLPQLDSYDAPLLPALAALGLDARPVLWDDPAMDWSTPRAAVVRNTWDSHLRREAFVAWASKVGRLTRLYNPAEVLRWNTHKAYLRTLEARGVPFTPTEWVPRGGTVTTRTRAASGGNVLLSWCSECQSANGAPGWTCRTRCQRFTGRYGTLLPNRPNSFSRKWKLNSTPCCWRHAGAAAAMRCPICSENSPSPSCSAPMLPRLMPMRR